MNIAKNFDTDRARQNMIERQIRCWNVTSRGALTAIASVPRENFVPERYQAFAFADTALPFNARGERMLAPSIAGRILQHLEIRPRDRVLVIGAGSGYLTACLARLAAHVTSIDSAKDNIANAEQRLEEIGIGNCELVAANPFTWQPDEVFDAIAVTGSLPALDPRLEGWLAPGGRAFAVVGYPPAMEARLIRRAESGEVTQSSLFETVLPRLAESPEEPGFRF